MGVRYHTDVFEHISEEKKLLVLEAASEEFARLGYTAANINVIAKKAGISIGSIYKYFTTKENLFLTVCNQSVEMLTGKLNEIMEHAGDFFDKTKFILRIIQEHSREHAPMINLYNEITTEGNRELVKKLSYEMESVSAKCYALLLEEAAATGLVADDINLKLFAFLMDSLFMTLQFSYASEYYQERMKVFIDDTILERDELVIEQTMLFIRRAFAPPVDTSDS